MHEGDTSSASATAAAARRACRKWRPTTRVSIRASQAPCRSVKARPELIRFVRDPGGKVSIDLRGRAPGRGAYLCRDPACWTLARKRRALDRALKVTVADQDWSTWRSGIL